MIRLRLGAWASAIVGICACSTPVTRGATAETPSTTTANEQRESAAEGAVPTTDTSSVSNTRVSVDASAEGAPGEASDSGQFELVALPVPEFLDAVVALPATQSKLPVFVSTHGAGGDPEWTCNEWGERVRGRAVVVCPRGKAISVRDPYGFFYPDHFALEKEVLAAVAALASAMPERVEGAPMLYAGYSQGATMGALFLPEHAARFPHLVLTEGGFASWTRASAKKFAARGGKRVLFVCGGAGCRDRAKQSAAMLDAAGVETRVEHVEGGGHTDGGRVGERLNAIYAWAFGHG